MPLDPVPQWPGTGLDSLPDPTESTYEDDDGFEIDRLLQKHNAILEAAEAKLGSTVTGTPGRGKALIGKGSDAGIHDVVARANLLINGGMRVNQRVTMPTADNSYCLDRWRLLLGAANAATVSQEVSDVPTNGSKYALKMVVGSGNNNKFGAWQILEGKDVRHLRGKKVSARVTLRAIAGIATAKLAIVEFTGTEDAVSGDPISAWGAQGTDPTLAASYAYLGTPTAIVPTTSFVSYYLEGVTVGASANNLAVFVWSDDTTTTQTTDFMIATDIKLEEGEVCTAVDRRHFQQEIGLAQRYYCKSYAIATAPAAATAAGSIWFSTSDNETTKAVTVPVRYPVQMRATPTVTLYDNAGNSGKITTLTHAVAATDNVAPNTGVSNGTADGFNMFHSGAVAGVQFQYTAAGEL